MSLLDIYETTIEKPELITMDYFNTRPKIHGNITWYKIETPTNGYTTYQIPICVKYNSKCIGQPNLFISSWEDQMVQVSAVKFTYIFDYNILYYELWRHIHSRSTPFEVLGFKTQKLQELYKVLNVDGSAISPGHSYKNVTNIISFETIIDGFKLALKERNFFIEVIDEVNEIEY